MSHASPGRSALIFGEVLFDHLPEGPAVLGGAPLNVAAHLANFGAAPVLVSRIGRDAEGARLRAWCEAQGVDARGLQEDDARPTGRVEVTLADGQPSYEILPDQAYDAIDSEAALAAAEAARPALLYHGTLAARAGSRRALEELRRHLAIPVYVDVNLRDPWTPVERVRPLIDGAAWIKLNVEELGLLLEEPGALVDEAVPAAAQRLRERHLATHVLVTLGARGALIAGPGEAIVERPAEPVDDAAFADAVGAGDGLSAVVLLGLLRGWDLETLLERGVGFAAAVCTLRGALPADRRFYEAFPWLAPHVTGSA